MVMKPSKQVILNADDFGRSAGINAAVRKAHEQGMLTSTSLMITGEMANEAVEIARAHPDLAVGLHIVIVAGRAALPPARIPHLVDAQGRFSSDPVRAGLRYFFVRAARQELHSEIREQFERFAATGLPLAHVDGHVYMHLHPVALESIILLATEFGAQRIRIPRDDFALCISLDRSKLLQKAVTAAVYALLCRWSMRRLRRTSLRVTDRVYGLLQTGNMHQTYVQGVLRRLSVPSAELYFHPAMAPPYEEGGPNPGDLATLLSPTLPAIIAEHQLRPTGVLIS